MLFRMILYGVLFYVVWKIFRSVIGHMQQQAPRGGDRRAQKGGPKDFSNIQDAEFEDLTKKESGGPKPGQ